MAGQARQLNVPPGQVPAATVDRQVIDYAQLGAAVYQRDTAACPYWTVDNRGGRLLSIVWQDLQGYTTLHDPHSFAQVQLPGEPSGFQIYDISTVGVSLPATLAEWVNPTDPGAGGMAGRLGGFVVLQGTDQAAGVQLQKRLMPAGVVQLAGPVNVSDAVGGAAVLDCSLISTLVIAGHVTLATGTQRLQLYLDAEIPNETVQIWTSGPIAAAEFYSMSFGPGTQLPTVLHRYMNLRWAALDGLLVAFNYWAFGRP